MAHLPVIEIPKYILQTLNNLYEIERKLRLHGDPGNIGRNLERIKQAFMDLEYFYEDPSGQPFTDTKTDLEVSISGQGTEELCVVEVIKPIIRRGQHEFSKVIQKGIVVVQSKHGEQVR